MEVRACRVCKKLFNDYTGYEICPDCEKNNKEEADKIKDRSLMNKKRFMSILSLKKSSEEAGYEEVKKYISINPKANIMQISNATKVNPATIINWVKEDKLEFSEESKDVWFHCESCGVKIPSGRVCFRCKSNVNEW